MGRTLNIIAVTGANSGLGKEIVRAIRDQEDSDDFVVLEIAGPEADIDELEYDCSCDLTDQTESLMAADFIKECTGQILRDERGVVEYDSYYPILINCAGVNYIDWFEQADFDQFDRLMNINVKAGLMLVQNLIGHKPPLRSMESVDWFNGTGAILNIVSNASHTQMTNSAFYNASKGAMHIATLSLARELRKTHGICVFGISPNKLAGTGMSDYIESRVPELRGWTPEQAQQYQLNALPAGEETDPAQLAEFIAFLLSSPERHKYLCETVMPYGK